MNPDSGTIAARIPGLPAAQRGHSPAPDPEFIIGRAEELRRGLTIHLVSTIDEALLLALLPATRGATKGKAQPRVRAHAALQ